MRCFDFNTRLHPVPIDLRRTGELRLDTPVLLDDDELVARGVTHLARTDNFTAQVAYTYDNQSGSPDGQFYEGR